MEINKEHISNDPLKVVIQVTKKKQILLANTGSNMADYFTKIETRYNSKYDKRPAYVIDLEGTVYQLYNPEYYSNFMDCNDINEMIIPVVLENVGWVVRDARDNMWYDWKGHVYHAGTVIQKEWRSKKFWASYSNLQIESLVQLCDELCTKFKIPKVFIGDNITTHKPKTFRGIINRSNYSKLHLDLSPAMNFDLFNEKITSLPSPLKRTKV